MVILHQQVGFACWNIEGRLAQREESITAESVGRIVCIRLQICCLICAPNIHLQRCALQEMHL
jgi:hypothetical protein